MNFFSKRKRIIKKTVVNTVKAFTDRTPEIYNNFFYGEFDSDPKKLVICYLFETDAELKYAEISGFCDELEKLTIENLISSGYPKNAFEDTKTESLEKVIAVKSGAEEDIQRVFDLLENKKAKVAFTTQEDIDKKANGDYHLYFQ